MKKLLLIVVACFAALPAHADIVIGLVGARTGPKASWAEAAMRGASQAVADINAQGGIRGQNLVLDIVDDACDPARALSSAVQISNASVKFVVGHACSPTSVLAAHVYDKNKVLMISALSTDPALTEAGYKSVFRVCGRDDQQGAAQASYFIKYFRNWKLAILHDDSDVDRQQATFFQKTIAAAGVREVLFDSYKSGQKDYADLVANLRQNGVQVLDINGQAKDVGLIAAEIKKQQADIQIIGGDKLMSNEFRKAAAKAGEGVIMTSEADALTLPDAQAVVTNFQQAHYEPTNATLRGYAAIQVLADGMKLAGYPDSMKVAAILHKNSFNTVIGQIGFDDKGDIIGSGYTIYRWRDGKYEQAPN